MPETIDPTFYRSPAAAIAAPPESLAYVAAFDPAGEQRDAIAVIDCEADSSSYAEVVGWALTLIAMVVALLIASVTYLSSKGIDPDPMLRLVGEVVTA